MDGTFNPTAHQENSLRKWFISIAVVLCMVIMTAAPASADRPLTRQTTYIGPFDIPAEWKNSSTVQTLLFNLYRPLAHSNIGSQKGRQSKFQYLAFYFCHPVFTPRQCFDNNDPIGNAVVMLPIKPMAAPASSATFDGDTVKFREKLVVWFPNTPEGSTSCVSMTDRKRLPFLALTRRGLTDLRELLAVDKQRLKTVTTVDGSVWLPDAPGAGNFTWRCSRLQ